MIPWKRKHKSLKFYIQHSNNLSYYFVQFFLNHVNVSYTKKKKKRKKGKKEKDNNKREEPKMEQKQMHLTIFEMNITTLNGGEGSGGKELTPGNFWKQSFNYILSSL